MKVFSGQAFIHLVQDAAFGRHDKFGRRVVRREGQDSGGRSHIIGMAQNRFRALRMRQNQSPRVPFLQLHQALLGKHFVNDAAARPKRQFAARFLHQEAPEVLVRREQNGLLGRNLADNFLGVA